MVPVVRNNCIGVQNQCDTRRVHGTRTTLVDYSTEYYYSPKVFVSLSGSDGSYSYWYRPVGGAGACTNGNYAFGDVSVAPTPGPRTPFRALILSISTTTTIKSTLDVPGVAVTCELVKKPGQPLFPTCENHKT